MDTSLANGPATTITATTAVDEATKKDRALADFMLMLDDYEPLVCWILLYLVLEMRSVLFLVLIPALSIWCLDSE